MREIRLSGLEGGGAAIRSPYHYPGLLRGIERIAVEAYGKRWRHPVCLATAARRCNVPREALFYGLVQLMRSP